MSSIIIALVVLACVVGAAVVGFLLNVVLPSHHLNAESKDSVKMAIGVLGTLTALVLGLLVGTAKNSYDAKAAGVTQVAADIILLDRVLAEYGPEASQTRSAFREAVVRRLKALWTGEGINRSSVGGFEAPVAIDNLARRLRELKPGSDDQRALQSQALAITSELARTHLLTIAQAGGTIPTAFLFILTSWLIIMFAGLGVLTPRNATAWATVFLCALSVTAALFLILELDTPYGGLIRISDAPIRLVFEQLGR